MVSKAIFKYVRISSQKVQRVVNLVRGENVQKAIDLLNFCPQKASVVVSKAIKSAIANANVKGGVDVDNLVVSKITVGQGPTLKRWRAKARRRARRRASRGTRCIRSRT